MATAVEAAVAYRLAHRDLDGVINRVSVRDGIVHPPQRLADLELLPGVPEALRLLRSAGCRLRMQLTITLFARERFMFLDD